MAGEMKTRAATSQKQQQQHSNQMSATAFVLNAPPSVRAVQAFAVTTTNTKRREAAIAR